MKRKFPEKQWPYWFPFIYFNRNANSSESIISNDFYLAIKQISPTFALFLSVFSHFSLFGKWKCCHSKWDNCLVDINIWMETNFMKKNDTTLTIDYIWCSSNHSVTEKFIWYAILMYWLLINKAALFIKIGMVEWSSNVITHYDEKWNRHLIGCDDDNSDAIFSVWIEMCNWDVLGCSRKLCWLFLSNEFWLNTLWKTFTSRSIGWVFNWNDGRQSLISSQYSPIAFQLGHKFYPSVRLKIDAPHFQIVIAHISSIPPFIYAPIYSFDLKKKTINIGLSSILRFSSVSPAAAAPADVCLFNMARFVCMNVCGCVYSLM